MSVSTSETLRIIFVFAFLYMSHTFLFLLCLLFMVAENWIFQKIYCSNSGYNFPFPTSELVFSCLLICLVTARLVQWSQLLLQCAIWCSCTHSFTTLLSLRFTTQESPLGGHEPFIGQILCFTPLATKTLSLVILCVRWGACLWGSLQNFFPQSRTSNMDFLYLLPRGCSLGTHSFHTARNDWYYF